LSDFDALKYHKWKSADFSITTGMTLGETPVYRLLAIWRTAADIWGEASKRHIGLIAAGVAFFGMFGVFPGIAAVIAVFGLVADPVVVADQLELMREVIPADAYDIFAAQIDSLLNARSETLGWATLVSIMLALWSSRAAVGALMSGINAIEAAPLRGGIRQMLVALLLTASLVMLATVALLSVVILPVIIAFVPLPVSTAWVLEGVSVGLSYYLTNFASYNEVYGSIGAVIGLLLWLYISAYLILLGAILNAKLYFIETPASMADRDYQDLLS